MNKLFAFLCLALLSISFAQDCSCQNGGSCPNNETTTTTCDCPEGTSGSLCENCDCQNGGSCSSEGCQCPLNTVGRFCETVLCGCLHGGVCVGEPPKCQCPQGTSGDRCERLEDCECLNGGTCQFDGEKRCVCPPGTSGELCETWVLCGSEMCQNGSPCLIAENGTSHCDCRMITIHNPNKHYAGQFCQYEATDTCGSDLFCVNGGVCQDEGDGLFTCDCPDEWIGHFCEVQNSNHISPNCTKTCLNGGECHMSPEDPLRQVCICPTGFAGMQCEHLYEECGEGELICLHGNKCVPPQGEEQPDWTCACQEGKACQQHRSSMCPSSDVTTSVYRGMTSLLYCLNDGVCVTYEQKGKRYPACQCPPQYTGPHCEFIKPYTQQSDAPMQSNNSAASKFSLFVTAILIVIVVFVVLYARAKVKDSREKSAIIEAAHKEGDRTPMIEQVDFELEDVELL